jgi:energy-coupling factor transporter ATP-binding protein EcfA2
VVDPVTAYEAIRTARDAADLARDLGLVDKILRLVGRDNKVLVLGSTGCGKSQFVRSLSTAMPEFISSAIRTEFSQEAALKIGSELFTIIDTPGHDAHELRRRQAVKNLPAKGTVGVINLTSFGYHEYDVPSPSDAVNSDGSAVADYLERHRAIEIERIRTDVASVAVARNVGWFVTLANQADVMKHYRTGDYSGSLAPLVGSAPIVIPYCAVSHKFFGRGNLDPTFDDSDRKNLRIRLLNGILAAVDSHG